MSAAGRTACRNLNAWLSGCRHPLPRSARVSPALRTRQTAQLALDRLPVRCLTDESLWMASIADLTDQIQQARPSGELWLIGHNPGLEELIHRLGCALPVPGLKPGTLVVIELPERGPAQVLDVVPPNEST
ncbi:hypothetical protein AY599_07635 [Leptolyngbya valderiana BDU 20041]|nr:hypothetical protein AY599_07635 [Leptolyngbya valderiana BDU 20041]